MASIQTKGNALYVVYDYTDMDGNRKVKWETCDSEKQAKIRKAEIELAKAHKKLITPNSITVAEFIEKWIPIYARKRWAFKTYTGNLSLINNHILPYLGKIPLQKLTTEDIDILYDTLRKKKKRTGAACKSDTGVPILQTGPVSKKDMLSTTTIKEVHDILRVMLANAVEWKYLNESPIPREGPKRNRDFEQAIWDDDLMEKALSEITDPLLHLAVHCAFICSLRNGEALGITLDCVELDYRDESGVIGGIRINKTMQRVSKEALEALPHDSLLYVFPTVMEDKKSCLILKDPKTRESKRFVFLTQSLRTEIGERIKRIETDRQIYGKRYHDHNLLFCLPNGNPIEPKLLEKWFTTWQKNAETSYPPLVFHGIRHSSLTYKLIKSNGDFKAVQGDSGHARMATLTDVYGHVQDKTRIKLNRDIDRDFYQERPTPSAAEEQLVDNFIGKLLSDPPVEQKVLCAHLTRSGIK